MFRKLWLTGLLGLLWAVGSAVSAQDKIRVLLIDGQNNHDWRSTTPFMKKALEDNGRFVVTVATAPERPKTPAKPKSKDDKDLAKYEAALAKFKEAGPAYKAAMARFCPDLGKFDVILSNYNGDAWPTEFQAEFEQAVKTGKIGLVVVHAANNSFGGWFEYRRMVGMGWYGKDTGDRLLLDDQGKAIRVAKGKGDGPGHRYSGKFTVTVRDGDHPITKGMPREWLHNNDELYDNMRGPLENIHLLATAFSPGTKAHEPMIWTISYGKGRVFHTPMGHDLNGMRCIGFVTTLCRGTEWAATGRVTCPIPSGFPSPDKVSTVPASKKTK